MKNETRIKDAIICCGEKCKWLRKIKINMEIILFLILGFLLGVVIKTEAGERVTIGFDDYKVAALQRGYDLNQAQKNVAEKTKAEQEKNGDAPAEDGNALGGTCGN